ncbi:MAG: protein-L-isoaspartate O-methyltransferase [Aggregatilineales bacterium]
MNRKNALRKALVNGLKRNRVVTSKRVERAFGAVPRHSFVPTVSPEQAYQDQVVVVKVDEEGYPISSSSQPTMMAIMLEQLNLRQGMRVLEIGTGSGYNAALMAHIVGDSGHVVSIDIDDDLVSAAQSHLVASGYDKNVTLVTADGVAGYPKGAPYDRIILTAAGWDISPAWDAQLKPDGLIVMPIVLNQVQFSVTFKRQGDEYVSQSITRCRFMPMRGDLPGRSYAVTLQLAPEVSLTMTTSDEQAPLIDVDTVNDWLLHPQNDINTGFILQGNDLAGLKIVELMTDAKPLHHCDLYATGNATETGLFPYFMGSTTTMRQTNCVINENGLMALMRPPNTPIPQKPDFTSAFPLWIRTYGTSGDNLAQEYIALLKAWDHIGRPDDNKLSIKIIPKDRHIPLSPYVYVLQKKWNQAILTFY